MFFPGDQGPSSDHHQRPGGLHRGRHRGVLVPTRAPQQRRGDGKLCPGGEEAVQADLSGQRRGERPASSQRVQHVAEVQLL